jgi:hypothetical protein
MNLNLIFSKCLFTVFFCSFVCSSSSDMAVKKPKYKRSSPTSASLAALLSNAESIPVELSDETKSPLIDQLTAMFYHVQNTKKCGDNLERFNIDLEPLWSFKFNSQIKKFIKLANLLNSLLADYEIKESTNSNQNANTKSSNSNTIVQQIFDSNLLISLNHFLFFEHSTDLDATSSVSSATFIKDSSANLAKDKKDKRNYITKYYGNYIKDPFIAGYGVALLNDPYDPNSKIRPKREPNCMYIYRDSTNEKNGTILSEKSCESINFKLLTAKDEYDDIFNYDSGGGNYANKLKSRSNEKNGFLQFEDLLTNNENTVKYCHNWYSRLYRSFRDTFNTINASGAATLISDQPLEALNYELFLQTMLKSKNFTKSLWCGPFYDCNKKDDWFLIHSLPLFNKEKKSLGAVVLKIKLTNMDINQCSNGDPIFANTNKCKPKSECIFSPSNSFKMGSYKCKCNIDYINSYLNHSSYDGVNIENQYWLHKNMKNNSYDSNFNCLPCLSIDCCANNELIENALLGLEYDLVRELQSSLSQCRKYNVLLRYIILIIQIIFVFITFVLSIIIFCFRQNKVIFYKTNEKREKKINKIYNNLLF